MDGFWICYTSQSKSLTSQELEWFINMSLFFFISFPKQSDSLLLADLLCLSQDFKTNFIYEPDYLDNSDCN